MHRVAEFVQSPLFRGVITLGALALVLKALDLRQTASIFGGLRVHYFLLAVLAGVVANLLGGLAWQVLLEGLGVNLPLKSVANLYLAGLFFAQFSPGGVAGDALRVYQLHRTAGKVVEGFTSIFFARLASLGSLVLFGAVAGQIVLPGLPSSRVALAFLVGMVISLIVLVLVIKSHQIGSWLGRLPAGRLNRVSALTLSSVRVLLGSPRPFASSWMLYMAHHLLVIVAVYLSGLALGVEIPFPWVLVLVPLARILVLLPISISGLGVQELALVALLGQVGISSQAAFSLSILSQIVLIVVPLTGGLVFLFGGKRSLPAGRNGD